MSLEEMAKKYSEKWGVSIEEATKKVTEFIGKKPERKVEKTKKDSSKLDPETELPVFEAMGPLSKKIIDINQAAMSTAYTYRSLKELGQPPEELKTLKDKVDYFEKTLGQMADLMNTTMKGMQETLQVQKAEKEKEALLEEVADIIRPLKEQLDLLEKAKEGNGTAIGQLTPEKIIEVGEKATVKAQEFLQKRGFKVELPKGLTPDQVETMIQEKLGTAKSDWEKEKGSEVEIEKQRIQATEEILTGVVDRVFDIFLEPLKDKIHEAIEKGAFGPRKPAA